MNFKFFLLIICLIFVDNLISKFAYKHYNQNSINQRKLVYELLEDTNDIKKNCNNLINYSHGNYSKNILNTKDQVILFGNYVSKLSVFDLREISNFTDDIVIPVTKLIMSQNKLNKLKKNKDYIFISCINNKKIFVSISIKFRKGKLKNFIIH